MPLYYVALFPVLILSTSRGLTVGWDELAAWLTATFTVVPSLFVPRLNPPLWSLGVEIAFSLAFPFLVRAIGRFGIGRMVLLTVIVCTGARIVGWSLFPSIVPGPKPITHGLLGRLDEFLLGMLVADLYARRLLWDRAAALVALGTALVVGAWMLFDLVYRGMIPPVVAAVANNVLDLGFVLVLAGALVSTGSIKAALSFAPLQVIGMMCYSLYIWHWPIMHLFFPYWGRSIWGFPEFAARLGAFAVLTVAITILSYRFIEFRSTEDWRSLFLIRERPRTIGNEAQG
jgi:peptidoglycan/LPS O-acetylase OafA/YrhL